MTVALGEHQGWSLPPYWSATPTATACRLAVPELSRGHLKLDSKDDLVGMGPFPFFITQCLRIVKLNLDQTDVLVPSSLERRLVPSSLPDSKMPPRLEPRHVGRWPDSTEK